MIVNKDSSSDMLDAIFCNRLWDGSSQFAFTVIMVSIQSVSLIGEVSQDILLVIKHSSFISELQHNMLSSDKRISELSNTSLQSSDSGVVEGRSVPLVLVELFKCRRECYQQKHNTSIHGEFDRHHNYYHHSSHILATASEIMFHPN